MRKRVRVDGKRVTKLFCERCPHEWFPRKPVRDVRICPSCKSPYWDKPRRARKSTAADQLVKAQVDNTEGDEDE